MFCLRSWIPIFFIPNNASPLFIFFFLACSYFINRPCHYCSALLLILLVTSCYWSDRCILDFSGNFFESQVGTSSAMLSTAARNGTQTATGDINATVTAVVTDMISTTAGSMANAATEKMAQTRAEWTGVGLEWLRSLLGRREWRIDCLDLSIRL